MLEFEHFFFLSDNIVECKYSNYLSSIGNASRPNFHWDQTPEMYDNVVQFYWNFAHDIELGVQTYG